MRIFDKPALLFRICIRRGERKPDKKVRRGECNPFYLWEHQCSGFVDGNITTHNIDFLLDFITIK